MKKKIFLSLLAVVFCITLVGCNKNEKSDKWVLNLNEKEVQLSEEVQQAFNTAMKDYEGEKLEVVALLGQQVVAGTNYMFLCKTDKGFKVATIYNDLEGFAKVSSVTDFDVEKYVSKNISLDAEMLAGGWYTEIPAKPIMLEEKVQTAFDEALKEVIGVSYYPAALLAQREKDGTDYAVLAYGRVSDQNATTGTFIITLHVDENNKPKAESIASIDLKEFNK